MRTNKLQEMHCRLTESLSTKETIWTKCIAGKKLGSLSNTAVSIHSERAHMKSNMNPKTQYRAYVDLWAECSNKHAL